MLMNTIRIFLLLTFPVAACFATTSFFTATRTPTTTQLLPTFLPRGGGDSNDNSPIFAEIADTTNNDRNMSKDDSNATPDVDADLPQQGINGLDLIVDGWFHERGELWPGQAFTLQVKEVLHHSRSKYQDLLVFESTNHGNVFVLDGVIQSTDRDEFSYQEMMAHVPLFSHPNPRKVLVIGGGDGGVLREIARHPCVEEICICELDEEVIKVAKKYLPGMAKGFDDPRVSVHIRDGNKFMAENEGGFDVIITDSSDPVGPAAALFETPFYRAMHACLREGGIVCTQGECIWLHVDIIAPLVKGIRKFYDTVEYAYCTIPSYPSGQIGCIIATKETGTSSCKVPKRKPTEEVQKELRYYSSEVHEASFVLPVFAKRAIYGDDDIKKD